MDSLVVARSLRASIGLLAMEWLIHPTTFEKGAARGMPTSMAAYAVGRFGALGDVPPDNVVGAAFFWHPDLIHELWAEGRAVIEPCAGARVWADICAEWGETRLGDFDGAARLGEILELVVNAASPLGAPLFVGWRDLVTAPSGAGRTFQLAQAMRELRFSRHCVAVQAAGVSPLEAILSGAAPGAAKMFGWPEPYPDVMDLADSREKIEAHTDRLHAADLEVLSDEQRVELRELAKGARRHATGS
jgi:Helix-turn-helix family